MNDRSRVVAIAVQRFDIVTRQHLSDAMNAFATTGRFGFSGTPTLGWRCQLRCIQIASGRLQKVIHAPPTKAMAQIDHRLACNAGATRRSSWMKIFGF